nr:prolipoprotein diacylglyceryl transferase [Gordonia phthalatica]
MTDGTVLAFIPSPSQGVWHLGPVPIRAYALCIIVGIVVAVWWGSRRWQARGGQPGEVIDVALWAVPFGLVGGRLYHVLTDWETYFGPGGKGLGAAFRVWDGGLGIWGAVALGAVGAWIGARNMGIKLPPFGDAIAPAILLAQAIGRLGNYFNQELFGRPTDVPWGLEIFDRVNSDGQISYKLIDGVSTGNVATIVHPTFLYEMVWNILIVLLLVLIDRKFKIGHGRLFAMYVAGYCVGRFGVELMRDDFATHIFGIRINLFTAAIVFLCAALYVVMAPKGREQGLSMYWPDRAEELADEGAVGYIPPELQDDEDEVESDDVDDDTADDDDYDDEADDSDYLEDDDFHEREPADDDFYDVDRDADDGVDADESKAPAAGVVAVGGAAAAVDAVAASDDESGDDAVDDGPDDASAEPLTGGDAADDEPTADGEPVDEDEAVDDTDVDAEDPAPETPDDSAADLEDEKADDTSAEADDTSDESDETPADSAEPSDEEDSEEDAPPAEPSDEEAPVEEAPAEEAPAEEAPVDAPTGRVIPGREPAIVDSVSSQGYTVVPADDEELGGISIVEQNPGGSAGSIEIRRAETTDSGHPESSDESRSTEVTDEGDTPEEDR